jgi:hypothetical protein
MNDLSDNAAPGDGLDFGPYLQRYLAGDREALETLPEHERELALTLAPAFGTHDEPDEPLTGSGAPPRELDPIAIALGLVPGPDDVLGGRELTKARQRARLDLAQLLELLQQRGWDLTGKQVLDWHKQNTAVAPALMNAIAQTLEVPVRALRGTAPRYGDAGAEDYLDDAVIESYLGEWARDIGQDLEEVRERAQQTLASLNFRNRDSISRDDVLRILRAVRSIDPDGSST